METNPQPASQQQTKSSGRVLARTLAETLLEPTSNFPPKTQTVGLGGFRDSD